MCKKLENIIIEVVCEKKQISKLDKKYILKKIHKLFDSNGNLRKRVEKKFLLKEDKIRKDRDFKEVIKLIRENIGQKYGQFLTQDFKKKEEKLSKINTLEESIDLLKIHKSSRERFDYYDIVYENITKWNKNGSIADLACALNPVSYYFMKKHFKNINIFACDLNSSDMDFLNNFFLKFKIKGRAKSYDIMEMKFLNNEDFSDKKMVFLFKAIDSFEQEKKNFSKILLEKIPQKYIVVSFPKNSIVSKKEFSTNRLAWFEKYINLKKWHIEKFEILNEIFFLIKK
jgi:hypothetical protein